MENYSGIVRSIERDNGISKKTNNPWTKETYVVCVDERHGDCLHFSLLNEDINKYNIRVGDSVAFNMDFKTKAFPRRDKDGNPMYKRDQTGNPIPKKDAAGNLLRDANGIILYETEQSLSYDGMRWGDIIVQKPR